MTYLDYINHFWRKDREHFFKPEEVAIYFRLLDHANTIGWKAHFHMSLDRLMLEVGIRSRKPFDNARQRLREAGLLEFENGNGRGCTTKYTLLNPETTPKRVAKKPPLSATLSATLSGEVSGKKKEGFGKEKVAVHKTKIKNKIIESNDSANTGKISVSKTVAKAPAPEPWATWLAEHAPTVQRLRSPLTAKQWAKLVIDFTEPTVQDVLLAMENKADLLKKYTSANLTARDWCGRRQPPRPLLPLPVAGPPESVEPVLNPTVTAERQAQRAAEAAANRRRFRETRAETAAA